MNLRRQQLISAAVLGAATAASTYSLVSGLHLSTAFPWSGLIAAAVMGGAATGALLDALRPVRGEVRVRDARSSWSLSLLSTVALLMGGTFLIDRWQVQNSDQLTRTAFARAVRDVELRPVPCPRAGAQCVRADVDAPLMAELLQSAITAAGGRIEGGTLPVTGQGDRMGGEARVTLRAGLRQVPFTLRYDGPVIVGRAAPLPDSALPQAQATLERADD